MKFRSASLARRTGAAPAWRRSRLPATLFGMGGSSRDNERRSARSFSWAWLTGAIGLASIAPACASNTGGTAGPGGDGAAPANAAGAPGSASTTASDALNEPPPATCSQAGLDGTYTVPVTPELAPYDAFDVPSIQFCEHGGSASLSYDLPELLVGDATHVSFRGVFDATAPALELSGDQGSASCSESAGSWSCSESLVNVEVRTDKLRERFADMPAAEAAARTDVADVFSQDPIGVLTFAAP